MQQQRRGHQSTNTALSTSTNGESRESSDQSKSSVRKRAESTKSRRRRRRPAFPAQAYPLAKDEAELQHNFISFIDQSIFMSYTQSVRLVEPRNYARPDQFKKENASKQPTIDDVAEPTSFYGPVATFLSWNGLPARLIVGAMSYFAFPFIIDFLENATQSLDDEDLATLVNTFLPGVSIVLGTYFSLTISILYDRFTKMQEALNLEAGFLALTCNNLLHLFHDDQEAAIEGAQCIADQIRTMVFDSRGKETMGVIYSDPYARILALLKEHDQDDGRDVQLLGNIHSAVAELYRLRSRRMNFEALALAPTHFDVMTFLGGMLLTGFALGTVATAQEAGIPAELARILFASLVVCYTIFYEMSFDLNRPFDGIYQLRRSGAAMHFLHVKHLLSNHPLVASLVDFEEVFDEESDGTVDCDDDCEKRKAEIWFN